MPLPTGETLDTLIEKKYLKTTNPLDLELPPELTFSDVESGESLIGAFYLGLAEKYRNDEQYQNSIFAIVRAIESSNKTASVLYGSTPDTFRSRESDPIADNAAQLLISIRDELYRKNNKSHDSYRELIGSTIDSLKMRAVINPDYDPDKLVTAENNKYKSHEGHALFRFGITLMETAKGQEHELARYSLESSTTYFNFERTLGNFLAVEMTNLAIVNAELRKLSEKLYSDPQLPYPGNPYRIVNAV